MRLNPYCVNTVTLHLNFQLSEDLLTQENRQFLEEVMQDRLSAQANIESPLAQVNVEKSAQWTPQTRRVGVIARKIGNYPLWSKEGKKMHTTLLQVYYI